MYFFTQQYIIKVTFRLLTTIQGNVVNKISFLELKTSFQVRKKEKKIACSL